MERRKTGAKRDGSKTKESEKEDEEEAEEGEEGQYEEDEEEEEKKLNLEGMERNIINAEPIENVEQKFIHLSICQVS